LSTLLGSEVANMPGIIDKMVATSVANEDWPALINNSVRALYRILLNVVNNTSKAAIRTAMRNFIGAQMLPSMQTQVNQLMTYVDAEVSRHRTATGTGTNASPDTPADPQLQAAVQQMQTQAQAMLNPPAPAGGGPANQDVNYTVNSMMGNNAEGTGIRAQQLERIAANFNANLRNEDEQGSNFTTRSIGRS
jgi:hypothetical protein